MVSFSKPNEQLPRYLQVLNDCGLEEFYIPWISEHFEDGRLWRAVPNRKWYTAKTTKNNEEVVLFHKLMPRAKH
jgi:hypothetical protein